MKSRFWVLRFLAATALALCAACGTTVAGSGGDDVGTEDGSGATDAASDAGEDSGSGSQDIVGDLGGGAADGAADTDPSDAVAPDSAAPDAEPTDAVASDAVASDAVASDAVAPDSAAPDAEPTDAGAPDTATPDAEPADAPLADAPAADAVDDSAPTDAKPPVDGGAADVPPPLDSGAVDAGPSPGCCNADGDCKLGQVCFFGPMKAGRCMNTTDLAQGQCWTNGQCGKGETCVDAMACGCNAICKAMDKAGVCKGPEQKACTVGMGADIACGIGEYCALPGVCSGEGVCTKKPDACIMLSAPVCGCDGKTYGNFCEASSSSVNVKGKGKCEAVNPCMFMKCGDGNACTADQCNPKTGQCEFPPLTGEKCDDGSLCTYGELCAEAGGKAYCKAGNEVICPPPLPCQLISCNAKTGQCETKPDPACGGQNKCSEGLGAPTIDCGADSFCQLPAGTCAGFGVCAQKPFACLAVYNPVCGCDGNSYGNDCEAHSNGQNWGSKGKCGAGGGDGCCKENAGCKTGLCVGGMCKDPNELKPGLCWSGEQCKSGKCVGASICPCGAACFAADSPGKCVDG